MEYYTSILSVDKSKLESLYEKQIILAEIYESSKFYEAGLVYILKVKYGYSEIIVNAFKKKGFNVRKWGNDDFCIDVSRPKALEEVVEECFDI